MPQDICARFRKWYEHERDCNAKVVAMLESVPAAQRSEPQFKRAVDLMAHLVCARRNWLQRMGKLPETPEVWFPERVALSDLAGQITDVETAWTSYLESLDDAELQREFSFGASDGNGWQWNVEGVLTQVNGHAWYHRGQIALLVDMLGGETVDTDYIFWHRDAHGSPERIVTRDE